MRSLFELDTQLEPASERTSVQNVQTFAGPRYSLLAKPNYSDVFRPSTRFPDQDTKDQNTERPPGSSQSQRAECPKPIKDDQPQPSNSRCAKPNNRFGFDVCHQHPLKKANDDNYQFLFTMSDSQ